MICIKQVSLDAGEKTNEAIASDAAPGHLTDVHRTATRYAVGGSSAAISRADAAEDQAISPPKIRDFLRHVYLRFNRLVP